MSFIRLFALISLLATLSFSARTDDGPYVDPNGRSSTISGGGAMDPNGGSSLGGQNCYSACLDPNG